MLRIDKKRAALGVALAASWASSGATAWAQISPGFANAVQQNLATQRQAAEAVDSGSATRRPSDEKAFAGRVEALFIAAQNYDGAGGLPSLRGCANDVRLWKTWFDSAYDENGAATILCDVDDADLAATATPSRENIADALDEKADKECDRLIVTFSGNGVYYGGETFFCPLDVKETSFADVDANDLGAVLRKGRENNLLALEDVLYVLRNAKAKEVVVVFDACRVGDGENDDFKREFTDLPLRRKNGDFYVLTSCSVGETAKETTVGGKTYGSFTRHFVEGLQGKADLAECCDGRVTLNEAYNYAQSKIRDKQSPEFFMAATQIQSFPTMTRVKFDGDDADLTEVDQWSDAVFLLRCGRELSRSNLTPEAQRVGEKALSAVLLNAPDNPTALELRGSVRRSLGDFEGALSDWERVGMKFQLYVKSKLPARGYVPEGADAPRYREDWNDVEFVNDKSEKTGAKAETFDRLTVAKFENGWAWITEKNNEPLGEQAGWVPVDMLTWDYSIAAFGVDASKGQPRRWLGRELIVPFPLPGPGPRPLPWPRPGEEFTPW